VPDSIRPVFFHVETGPIVEPYLLIEEIEAGGRRRELGPFAVRDASLRESFEDFESRLLPGGEREIGGARLAASPASDSDAGRVRSGDRSADFAAATAPLAQGVKIAVPGAGRVRVPIAELLAVGLPPAALISGLRLTNLGRAVPFTVEVSGEGTPAAVVFQAD
jgi:hypothetical protein